MNVVVVRGVLSSPPRERELPSGDVMVAYEVTSRDDETRSVPVVMFDPPARARRLDEGDEVQVVGSVRRRFYQTGGGSTSRTEVVAASVHATRARATCARALAKVVASLQDAG